MSYIELDTQTVPPILRGPRDELLGEVAELWEGDMPLLLTVPHDGRRTKVRDIALVADPHAKKWDRRVRYIARDVHDLMMEAIGRSPFLGIDLIQRRYRGATQHIFNRWVLNTTERLSEFGDGRPPLFLDLHGFSTQPAFGDFDLILGTGHRQSVSTDVDVQIGHFMQNRGYAVYIPSEIPRDGELFTASPSETLVNQVMTHCTGVDAVQLEIHRRFREDDAVGPGKQLAQDLTECLLEVRF